MLPHEGLCPLWAVGLLVWCLLLKAEVTADSYQGYKSHNNYGNRIKGAIPDSVRVAIDTSKVVHQTSERYLSIALDTSIVREGKKWKRFNISSSKLHTLSSALGPCYLRVGGTEADFLIFQPDDESMPSMPLGVSSVRFFDPYNGQYDTPKNLTNFTMNGQQWDALNNFAVQNNWRMLFDFNVLLRTGADWNYTNAEQLLSYTLKKEYAHNVDFELGNEPDAFPHAINRTLDPVQLGVDYVTLDGLLRKHHSSHNGFKNCKLVGPELTRPRKKALRYLDQFLLVGGSSLDAITWHHYYVNGRNSSLNDFINPDVLDYFPAAARAILNQVRDSGFSQTPVWLGETSSAWGGGAPSLSDRYVAGFLWLDKLGFASKDHEVVIRQTLYGGHYALLSNDGDPNPDYWLSLLYTRLVGQRVLNVTVGGGRGNVRFYAACSRSPAHSGDLVLYGLNLRNKTVTLKLPSSLDATSKDVYWLTGHGKDGLKSRHANLNGVKLVMPDAHTLPPLVPETLPGNFPVTVKPLSFGFIMLKGAKVKICL